jgi:hypothetical protein
MARPRLTWLDDRHVLYTFDAAGDTLELHDHPDDGTGKPFGHNAIIPVGSRFRWFTERNSAVVEGWHVIEFPAGVKHGMEAMSNGAEFVARMPRAQIEIGEI